MEHPHILMSQCRKCPSRWPNWREDGMTTVAEAGKISDASRHTVKDRLKALVD